MALDGRDRVGNPIGTDVARIVVANGNPGLRSRSDFEELRVGVPAGELVIGARELRNRGRNADAGHPPKVEEAPIKRTKLVAALVTLGRDSPVLGKLGALVGAENRLGVPDVDG